MPGKSTGKFAPLEVYLHRQGQNWPDQKIPNWEDFQKGHIFFDPSAIFSNSRECNMGEPQSDSLLELFRELLEDFPVILVTSPQDRGKTVCCLGIGTKLLDPSTVVVYSEAKDFEVDVAQSYIESPYQGTTIMMVDDVHLIGEDVAEFVPRCGAAGGRFKCLLISRAVSLPEDLRPLPTISLSPTFEDGEQMFRRNLKMLAHKATFKEMPNITEAYQNAGEVLQIIYAEEKPPLNLGRLYSFFHIWKPAMHPAIEVARNLDVEIRRLLAETPEIQSIGRRSVLLPIAALSSLEIPAHETYVSELGHEDERLELEKNILHKQAVGRTGSVYRINASDAQNYLEAAEESNKLLPLCVNAKEFVKRVLCDYFTLLPPDCHLALQIVRRSMPEALPELLDVFQRPQIMGRLASVQIAKFLSLFSLLSGERPSLAQQLWQTRLESSGGLEEGFRTLAKEISGLGPSAFLIAVRGVQRAGLDAFRGAIIGNADWEALRSAIRQGKTHLGTLNSILLSLRRTPEEDFAVRNLLRGKEVARLLQGASFNSISRFLRQLAISFEDIARDCMIKAGPQMFARKIRDGINLSGLAYVIRIVRGVPGFDRKPLLEALNRIKRTPKFSTLVFLLGEFRPKAEETDPEYRELWKSFLPVKSDFPRFLRDSSATQIHRAASAFPAHITIQMLRCASKEWKAILERSSLGSITQLLKLRRVAKALFERGPAAALKARELQERCREVLRVVSELGLQHWPLARVGTYRQLLLHAVSLDQISLMNLDGVLQTQPVAPDLAMQILELKVARSLELETEFRQQSGELHEAFGEWTRFFWTLYRAGEASVVLGGEGVQGVLRRIVDDGETPVRERLMLCGLQKIAKSHFLPTIPRELVLNVLYEMRIELSRYNQDPEKYKIEPLFFYALELAGLLMEADSDAVVRSALCEFDLSALTRFLDQVDNDPAKLFNSQLLSDLRSIGAKA